MGEYQARYRMKISKLRGEHTVASGVALFFDVYNPQYGVLKKDSVLIIDDVVRTGETVQALVDLVRNQRADIAGIYVLVTVGNEWKEFLANIISKYSFEVLIEI